MLSVVLSGAVRCGDVTHRHGCFVRLWSDFKGLTSMMSQQVQCVTNDDACNTHDDCDTTNKKTQRANSDTQKHAPSR